MILLLKKFLFPFGRKFFIISLMLRMENSGKNSKPFIICLESIKIYILHLSLYIYVCVCTYLYEYIES